MSFYLTIQKAKNIKRDEDGFPYSWTSGKQIAEFRDAEKFMDYVRANIKTFKSAVAFTGSASLLTSANGFITNELKKAGLL